MNSRRILLVSRDQLLISLCKRSIDHEIGTVMTAADCDETLDAVDKNEPQLVILDTAVSGSDCLGLSAYLTRSLDIPIIVIGNNSLKSEKLHYLESGIKSFIDRPVDPEELAMISKVVFQKQKQGNHEPVVREFASGNLRIDYTKRRVTLNGNEVTLTPLEYDLLKELTVQAGTPLSYHHLLQTIWGPEFINEKQYLYVYIGYLRKKIEDDPQYPKRIITIPRIGYVFKTGE